MIKVKYTLRGYLTNWHEYEGHAISLTKGYISDYPIELHDIGYDTPEYREVLDKDIIDLIANMKLTGKHIKITIEEEGL